MKQFPSIPHVENAPDGLFEAGHLWLLEKVDGAPLRFQLQSSGLVRFGDRHRVYDDPADVPVPYQHAVGHVQEQLDRTALRAAVDDVEEIVFFGEAMHQQTIDYDWDRTPSVLGFDIWSASENAFRPPDAVEQIFDQLGLHSVNTFDRERPATHFDPDSYTIPDSAWYDGPAEGVVISNKRGQRATLDHPNVRGVDETAPVDIDVEELAAEYATERRFEELTAKLDDRGDPVTVETLLEHTIEDLVREQRRRLFDGSNPVDMSDLRTAVAALTRRYLTEKQPR